MSHQLLQGRGRRQSTSRQPVLAAGHWKLGGKILNFDWRTKFICKKGVICLEESIDAFSSVGPAADAHLFEHEIEAVPAAGAAVWSKHGMRTEDVHLHSDSLH